MRNWFFLFFFLGSLVNVQAQNTPNYVPLNGLVGWWPFSGNASDSSGLGNNGSALNAVLAGDRFGNANAAYLFNGSNTRIDVPDAVSLRVQYLTVSVWVLSNSAKPAAIIYKGSMSADGEAYGLNSVPGIAIKINSNCVTGAGWKGLNLVQPLTQTTWEHLVVSYDGQLIKFYRNGRLDSSVAQTGAIDQCAGGALRFGFNHLKYNASTGDPFNGVIDDIGIWNRALNEVEVKQLYFASTAIQQGNVGINTNNPQRALQVTDVLRLTPRSFAPPSPAKGDTYFDSVLNKLRVFDGMVWQNCW